MVTEIHDEIKLLESENRKTIIIGDHNHDEDVNNEETIEDDSEDWKNELLEIIYLIQQKQNIGNFDSNMSISESDNTYIDLLSKNVKVLFGNTERLREKCF